MKSNGMSCGMSWFLRSKIGNFWSNQKILTNLFIKYQIIARYNYEELQKFFGRSVLFALSPDMFFQRLRQGLFNSNVLKMAEIMQRWKKVILILVFIAALCK